MVFVSKAIKYSYRIVRIFVMTIFDSGFTPSDQSVGVRLETPPNRVRGIIGEYV